MLAFDISLKEFFYVSEIVVYCFIDNVNIGVGGFRVKGVSFVNWPYFSNIYLINRLGGWDDSCVTSVAKTLMLESKL